MLDVHIITIISIIAITIITVILKHSLSGYRVALLAKCLLHRPEDSAGIYGTRVKSQVQWEHLRFQNQGGRGRRMPGVHKPASLAKLVCIKSKSVTPSQKINRWLTQTHICVRLSHTHADIHEFYRHRDTHTEHSSQKFEASKIKFRSSWAKVIKFAENPLVTTISNLGPQALNIFRGLSIPRSWFVQYMVGQITHLSLYRLGIVSRLSQNLQISVILGIDE